jgi:hypothetical protein
MGAAGSPYLPLITCWLSFVCCSYPVVIGSVLGLFSCKQLNSPATVPGEVNAAVGNFWNRVSTCNCDSSSMACVFVGVFLAREQDSYLTVCLSVSGAQLLKPAWVAATAAAVPASSC